MSSSEKTPELELEIDIWDTTEAFPAARPGGVPSSARLRPSSVPPSDYPQDASLLPGPVQASSVLPPGGVPGLVLPAPPTIPLSGLSSDPPSKPATGSEPVTPQPRSVLAPGEQFGVYRVGQCIGEGGMARIYQAEHAGLRRQVALKVLLDASTRVPEGRERFLREARIAAAIKHPNVVNIFDVGVHEDTAYLVMELLNGTDLEQLIQSRGALDEGTIVDIMIPVLAGLTAVHDAGVVHRDLKPGNVFLAQGRYDEVDPKLLDFGICKAPGPEQLRLTANGMLIGTPFYMSPEGLRGEEMTPSSDQYSLGVVMYECATGTNPFGATTFAEIFRLIGSGEYPPPSAARPQISKRLERIIVRAMSLDPAQRFKDLREMGRELLQLAGQRTRITWALSFGDLPRPNISATGAWKVPERSTPPQLDDDDKRRRLRRRALLAAPWLILAAVAIIWWSGAFSPPSQSAARPATGSPFPVAQVAPASGAPAVAATLGPGAPLAAQPASVADAPSVPKPLGPYGFGLPRRAWPRRHPLSSGNVTPDKPDDSEPDWAIHSVPATGQVKPAPDRTPIRVGANGAPIFD